MEFRFNKIITLLVCAGLSACGQGVDFGLPSQSNADLAAATYNNKVDVVFIVDDSESMKYPQQSLMNAIPTMVSKLTSSKLDLRIGVISTSMGGSGYTGGKLIGNPKYLTLGTPNVASVLQQRLNLGTAGRAREAGMESLFSMLQIDGGMFLREDAYLAIIEITNEDDNSGLGTVDEYIAEIDSFKKPWADGRRSWMLNLIATLDTSSICPTNPDQNYTEKAVNLMDMVTKTGGQMESVCSTDLTGAVSNIRARIVQVLSEFRLTKVPNVSTIKVYMNGALVPHSNVNGWDYIPSINTVRFYGSYLPAADAKITINFDPAGAN
jgi:hypothetical protein